MGITDYLVLPFKGVLKSISSYRFFTGLAKNKTSKCSKILKNSKSLHGLEEVYTGLSPIHVIIRENKEDLLKVLLQRKDADKYINLQENKLKWAPIHFASSNGSVSILNHLLPYRPNLLIKTQEGLSPIHIASGKGYIDFVLKLLENGVHIDERDSNNWTALHYAASQDFIELIEKLLQKGAKTAFTDKNGLTPLFAAILHGHINSVQLLYKYKDGHKGESPLRCIHWAAGLQDSSILEWLFNQGEDLKQVDNSGAKNTALHFATLGKSGQSIKFLLKKGFDINVTDSKGSSALHIATIEQDQDIIKILCENGAKVTLQNDEGLCPLDIAESLRNSRLEILLKRYK
ncbi:hypothetical protein SteCoe_37480 [Stentor coeruleus]|uniref:Uncharacterized protein n=1 Tax=Stentor coeruleus TaxID=5963 RepID=A0A1R2AN16_9CILI|nr:hypothetical protein SteCoe_37480 [Stentor coeruleus]